MFNTTLYNYFAALGLPESLADKSSITARQLEVLASYMRVVHGEMNLKQAANSNPNKSVTVGSYYRTVKQARTNLRQSVVTVLLGIWMDAIKAEDVRRLFDLVSSGGRELSDEEQSRFLQVLEVLLDRVIV